MMRRSLSFASVGAVLAACSATSSSTTTSGDTSTGGGSASSTVSASSASMASAGGGIPNGCNGLRTMAPEIQPTDLVAAPPTPMGGSIADGTYFLSAETHYEQAVEGPDGKPRKTMLVVSGKKWELVSTTKGELDYQANELVDPKG